MWKVCAVAALAIALTPAEGLLQGNQNRQQQRRQEWSTAVAAAPPSPPSPAKNAKISAHLLGGEPLPLQPKAPTPSSCPGGCAANGECDTSTPTATCLCHAGFVGSDCRTAHYQGYALLLDPGSAAMTPPMGKWPSFTLSLWVRVTVPSHEHAMTLFEAGDGDVVVAIDNRDRITFQVKSNAPRRAVFTNSKLTPFEWTHVGVVYSRRHAGRTGTGSTTLYIDGAPVQTLGYWGVAAATHDVDLKQGTLGSARNYDASAIIDEVRMFSHALSPAIMKQHPYGRLSGREENLLAYYRLDEGALTVLRDHAAGGSDSAAAVHHDGSLKGFGATAKAPRWVQSWAPFEACTLRCSGWGKCLVAHNKGVEHQTCKCDMGFSGEDCEVQLCDGTPKEVPCSGHGQCTEKKAREVPGLVPSMPSTAELASEARQLRGDFTARFQTRMEGEKQLMTDALNASVTEAMDKVQAEARAAMVAARETNVWTCDCDADWGGKACSGRLCPGDCSGHGECSADGTCACDTGFRGVDCAILRCPNDCTGNGQCINGTCACDVGFSGKDCTTSNLCPNDCSGHGRCENGECWCQSMYTGDDCSWASSCYNFCSGRGKCVNDNCLCDPLFTGVDCSEARCPRDCSQRGDCIEGVCLCEAGFDGVACETEILWPMRCSAQRQGLESSLSCKRGLPAMDVPPPTGTQMFKVQFDAASGTLAGARKMSAVNADV